MGVLKSQPDVQEEHPIDRLIRVMARLRDPEGGCPWDLEQDFKSIAPFTIEEAYEVADAIARDSMADLREELGDLLLQSVYHAQMAAEAGHFNIYEVINGVADKMIARHPHVFGNVKAENASDVNAIWDAQKSKEKPSMSALYGVPVALPALRRAQKLQKKAAKTGFEWPDPADALDKLEEETCEMRQAVQSGDVANMAEELGDLLFVLANFARMLGIDAEDALQKANYKFISRFNGMELEFKNQNKEMKEASLDQMTQMWAMQKQKERIQGK